MLVDTEEDRWERERREGERIREAKLEQRARVARIEKERAKERAAREAKGGGGGAS